MQTEHLGGCVLTCCADSTSRGTGLRAERRPRWPAGGRRAAAPRADRWPSAAPPGARTAARRSGRWTRLTGGRDTSRSGCCL